MRKGFPWTNSSQREREREWQLPPGPTNGAAHVKGAPPGGQEPDGAATHAEFDLKKEWTVLRDRHAR